MLLSEACRGGSLGGTEPSQCNKQKTHNRTNQEVFSRCAFIYHPHQRRKPLLSIECASLSGEQTVTYMLQLCSVTRGQCQKCVDQVCGLLKLVFMWLLCLCSYCCSVHDCISIPKYASLYLCTLLVLPVLPEDKWNGSVSDHMTSQLSPTHLHVFTPIHPSIHSLPRILFRVAGGLEPIPPTLAMFLRPFPLNFTD